MNNEPYDLEERTYLFAFETGIFLRDWRWNAALRPVSRQMLRSSVSVAASYVESLEATNAEDYIHRLRICKKEARESGLWFRFASDRTEMPERFQEDLSILIRESTELVEIFASIIRKKTDQPPFH